MAKELIHACKGILAKLNERPVLIGGAVPYFMRRGSLPDQHVHAVYGGNAALPGYLQQPGVVRVIDGVKYSFAVPDNGFADRGVVAARVHAGRSPPTFPAQGGQRW